MSQKIQGAQRDFSSGEIDVALKRADDHPARKTGLRQMANMRILNSGATQNRSGRTAQFPAPLLGRTEEITMTAGTLFRIGFGLNFLQVLNSAGVQLAAFTTQGNGAGLPWTLATVVQIVYAQFNRSVYLCFPNMRPQVLTWDGIATWTIIDYAELLNGGQKRTLFYRITPQGLAMEPGASSGAGVTLSASGPYFVAGHVGTRLRYIGRQMLITAVADSIHATVTIEETLPGSQIIGFASDPSGTFSVGDVVFGTASGSQGQVVSTSVAGAADSIWVQLLNNSTSVLDSGATVAFIATDVVVGPGGNLASNGVGAILVPQLSTDWDEEVINSLQGYPASCFVDQFRLGFCNFPTVPGGIAWSAINSPNDLYVVGATQPAGAIFELTPDKVQVLYVVPGPESSEFVFCDRKLYYIKIDSTTPLTPGSVGFQNLSSDGCAQVQPRPTQELILYVNAGRNSVMAITAPGAYYRPFNTTNLCESHSHLFSNIVAIAVPTADGTFNERYAYVLNSDGSIAVGKYNMKDGQTAGSIGWGPWSGAGVVSWIASFAADVLFTTTYFGGFTMCELLDDTMYLDGSVLVNAVPAAMAPQPGLGPLWWAANQSVFLMDQVSRPMGIYQVDANGNIIPQNVGGENLKSASLVAGLSWTSTVEPFVPDANPGADVHQRMFKRRVSRFAAYVIHSTGFIMARLFAGPVTRTSPPLGTVMNFRRVTAYNQDDDATLPPPQRETAERTRPIGRAFDPRVAIIKDTPGPLLVAELGMEASV